MAKALNRTREPVRVDVRRMPPADPTRVGAGSTQAAGRSPAGSARAGGASLSRPGRRVVRTPVILPGENAPLPPPRDSGRPRRLLTTLCFLLIVVGMLLLGRYAGSDGRPAPATSAAAGPEAGSSAKAAAGRPGGSAAGRQPQPAAPETGGSSTSGPAGPEAGTSGRFAYVSGFGPVLGRTGPIHRFRVALERPSPAEAGPDFADQINRTLGDHRSWIASGRFRLQRVPETSHAEFTIYLASPRTSERMCSTGGLETGGYTSCRLPGKVIINDARWDGAVRDYHAPISTYRRYAINHEVGHQLGHGHEKCPGAGRPAPVMMQQTLGLKGCVANAWPYLDGRRYTGPPTA
jgi:hypothetical protein